MVLLAFRFNLSLALRSNLLLVIPAKAGIQCLRSNVVIPAKAGIHFDFVFASE
jgi:hypothetical protein